jgi:secreted trypsin-like serine protease
MSALALKADIRLAHQHVRYVPEAEVNNYLVSSFAMPRVLSALVCLMLCAPASALTGNAPPASGFAARPIVMIIDSHDDLCTGTALARDLVLTAAHCVARLLDYQVKTFQTGQTISVRSIARHPRFDLTSYAASRATADLALLKLAAPLADLIMPASLAPARRVAVGETLTVAGFGVTAAGTDRGLGIPRMATLAVTGKPGSLQIRLVDPAMRNLRIGQNLGLGACTGDSGAPVFDGQTEAVIGVVSWSTAPGDEEGCGGLTGVTPLLLYRDWIVDTARKFNSPLGP